MSLLLGTLDLQHRPASMTCVPIGAAGRRIHPHSSARARLDGGGAQAGVNNDETFYEKAGIRRCERNRRCRAVMTRGGVTISAGWYYALQHRVPGNTQIAGWTTICRTVRDTVDVSITTVHYRLTKRARLNRDGRLGAGITRLFVVMSADLIAGNVCVATRREKKSVT